jgi:hypothetical protein
MKLDVIESLETLEKTYTLTITHSDMSKANITHLDRVLFEDCNKDDSTISDKLLALETLARRIEEGVD